MKKSLLQPLLLVALLGGVICIFGENRHAQIGSLDGTIQGEVVGISSAWTMNGDGGITVLWNGKRTSIGVIGVLHAGWPETKVKLISCKYIHDLMHKNVEISGTWHCGTLIASYIKEID